MITAAGWDITRPLGLVLGGLSCLIIETLSRGERG